MRTSSLALFLLCSWSAYAQELKIPETAANSPIEFIENRGQVGDQHHQPRPDVLFYGTADGLQFHLRANGVSYQQRQVLSWKDTPTSKSSLTAKQVPDQLEIYRTDINWIGTNPDFEVEHGSPFQQRYNFYQPVCPNGVTGVSAYDGVTFKNIYDGVDLAWYTNRGTLEYDFIVQPGYDYEQIQWEVEGAESIAISDAGELVIRTALGEIREQAPIAFQGEEKIAVNWTMEDNRIGFEVPEYEEELALVIDPLVRSWGTYYGDTDGEWANAVDHAPDGSIYAAGQTGSTSNMATTGAHQTVFGGINDGFIIKFDASGNRLWSTYVGGNEHDYFGALIVDTASLDIFVAGQTATSIASQIVTSGSFDDTHNGFGDGLVARFDANGTRVWSSYIGAGGNETVFGLALGQNQDLYLTGNTSSSSGLAVNALHQSTSGGGTWDVFVARVSQDGNTNHWTTYYGGSGYDQPYACTSDQQGNVYVTGEANSSNDIATTGSHDETLAGTVDAFIAKFDSLGNQDWGTYFGGSGIERAECISFDGDNSIYVGGSTNSAADIGTAGTFQPNQIEMTDGFLTRFSLAGDQVWGTYYGDTANQVIYGCYAVDSLIYITGLTFEPFMGLMTTSFAFQSTFGGGLYDSFLARFDSTGTRHWASLYGGQDWDQTEAVTVDDAGDIIIAGRSRSTNNIASSGAFQTTQGGDEDVLIAKFDDSNFNNACISFAASIDSLVLNDCVADTSYARAAVTGGNPPISYLWDDPQATTTPVVAVTAAGLNTVAISDSAGCVDTLSVWIDHSGVDTNHTVNLTPLTVFNPGFNTTIELEVSTTSCGYHQDQATLILPAEVTYQSAIPAPDSILGDTLIWNYDSLRSTNPFIASVLVTTDIGTPLGELLCFDFSIPVEVGETDATDNQRIDCFEVIGSFDPNDIQVQPVGSCDSNYILPSEELRYTIRFQNVGTAPAVNVSIYDTLDTNLDVSALQLLSNSHSPMVLEVLSGNVLHFRMDSIMLPDSTSDPMGSNGHVTFLIPLKPGTPMHTYIENQAAIYFDFNAPVITNTVFNTVIGTIPSFQTNLTENACGSYDYQGQTLTSSGVYNFDLNSAAGCDSTIVLDLTINQPTAASIAPVVCDSFLIPSGTQFLTTTGAYLDTIPNTVGCDSVITVNLTVNPTTTAMMSPVVCGNYTTPSGNLLSTSGTYLDTLPNSFGCDSVITVNLTVNNPSVSTTSMSACNSVISPSGSQTWTTSGTYLDTLTNASGCDSVMTINLTVYTPGFGNTSMTGCNSLTAPSGNQVWTTSGTYQDTLSTVNGCDSILTVQATILQGTAASLAPVVCNSYQSPGGQTLTASGVYQEVIPNSAGCDSVITIDLTVDQDSYNQVNVISCGPYSAPNGQVYTTNGLYVDSLSSIYGCDSVVETNLSIVTIFTGVNQFGDSLAAVSSGGGRTFQWLDCDNGFAPIAGETNFYFTPSLTGNYALEITQFGCTDTSACQAVQVSPTGIFDRESSAALRVFPNPTSGLLQLQFEEAQQEVEIVVYNPLGALVLQKQAKLARNLELNISGAAGMYFLHVRTAGQTWEVLKVRKE